MREVEFRTWLEARRWKGKPLTSISSRMSKARRFEKAMPTLGFSDPDLDAAFDRDGMEAVTDRLGDWCREAARTGQAPVQLVGETTNAAMRIRNVASAVRNYRQFREGTPAASAWPALDELRDIFLDRVPDFQSFVQTDNGHERIERTYKDVMAAKVCEIAASGDDDEQAGRRIFRALIPSEGPLLAWRVDDDFARKHPQFAPDFFATIGRLARDARPIGDAIMTAADRFAQLQQQGATALTLGAITSIAITVAGMARPHEAAPFKIAKGQELARLLTKDPIFSGTKLTRAQLDTWLDLLTRIETVMHDEWGWAPRDLIDVQGFAWIALDDKWGDDDEMDDDTLLARFQVGNDQFAKVRRGWTTEQAAAFCTIARAVHNAGLDWYRVNISGNPVRFGRKDIGAQDAIASVGFLEARNAPHHIKINDKRFDLEPADLTDADAAAFANQIAARTDAFATKLATSPTRPGYWPDEFIAQGDKVAPEVGSEAARPTNLILYGPPGTGKTFATAEHAVRLCGEAVPADRAALMARYRELSEEGRIRFVTFHQSYAYEDFVEGLRPMTGAEGEQGSARFRLEPVPGVFREVAALAEQAGKAAAGGAPFDVGGRQVFKMSLGRAGEEDHIFDAAVEGQYVVLGWGGDIDWTPYQDYDAVFARWNEDHPGTHGSDGNISQLWRFRCSIQVGDLVVISYGNSRYRAIGEIIGDYEFSPTGERDYNHRRKVRWLYLPDEPQPITFYDKPFTMRSCYLLREGELNRAALALVLPGTGGAPSVPKQFVLICDEINRANISKVFGELITLLEPDKRLNKDNALKVRLPYSGDSFGVPANLHIIGTMNTADRSIALIDKALRRRFDFVEVMPDYDIAGMDAKVSGDGVTLAQVLKTLNDRIEYLLDREHQIGHGWLLHCDTKAKLDTAMRGKIIPLIAEYFFEDWGRTADVLGGREDNPFLQATQLNPPPGMSGAEPRTRWAVREEFAPDAYSRLVG